MKLSKRIILSAILCSVSMLAADNGEIESWMHATGKAAGTLRKMETKTGDDAAAAAESLNGVYEKMIPFWQARNAADAVKFSEDGKAAAADLAVAAKANDNEKATAAFGKLNATCKGCHDSHRTKLETGKYEIK